MRLTRSGSRPSTWSVPVRPRDASSTTRNSAVVAKLMTMAVRTSACGSGSAYCDGSPVRARSQARRRPCPQPPHGDDEEIDRVGEQRQADDHLERARAQDQPHARARKRPDPEGQDDLHHSTSAIGGSAGAAGSRRRGGARWLRTDWCAMRDQHQHGRPDDEREHADVEEESARHRNAPDQGNLGIGEIRGQERASEKPCGGSGAARQQQTDAHPAHRQDMQTRLHPDRSASHVLQDERDRHGDAGDEAAPRQIVPPQQQEDGGDADHRKQQPHDQRRDGHHVLDRCRLSCDPEARHHRRPGRAAVRERGCFRGPGGTAATARRRSARRPPSTVISPNVSKPRKSTRMTFTMLVPPPSV